MHQTLIESQQVGQWKATKPYQCSDEPFYYGSRMMPAFVRAVILELETDLSFQKGPQR